MLCWFINWQINRVNRDMRCQWGKCGNRDEFPNPRTNTLIHLIFFFVFIHWHLQDIFEQRQLFVQHKEKVGWQNFCLVNQLLFQPNSHHYKWHHCQKILKATAPQKTICTDCIQAVFCHIQGRPWFWQ